MYARFWGSFTWCLFVGVNVNVCGTGKHSRTKYGHGSVGELVLEMRHV